MMNDPNKKKLWVENFDIILTDILFKLTINYQKMMF